MGARFARITLYRLGTIRDGTIDVPFGRIRHGAMVKCIAIRGSKAEHLRVIRDGTVVIAFRG
jgi:hypothetical protein